MLMLDLKGISFKRVDLMPVIAKGRLRLAGFPGTTVPALKMDRQRVQGSRDITRVLDRLRPDPPLLPTDPERRAEVERAEAWADETLQGVARRILWNAFRRDRAPMVSYSEGARLGVPIGLAVKTAQPSVALSARLTDASDNNVRADLAALPGTLERIDNWISEGVLGGEVPNAAGLQIACCVRLLMTFQDLRDAIARRPAGELAMRIVPDFAGDTPPILPPTWVEPLKG